MKKVVIRGVRKLEILEVPDPKAVRDWALVKIHSAPMCTEYKSFDRGDLSDRLGHEAAGEVVEIAQPGPVAVGDRVVVMPQYPCGVCPLCVKGEYIHCENVIDFEAFTGSEHGCATYAQYILKPAWLLPKIPDEISYDLAAMLCCGLGPTFGAMQRMRMDAFDTVLITGMGPVGLGGVINGLFRGARIISVVGNPYRAKLARKLGAHVVLDPDDPDVLAKIRESTGNLGADFAIDCSGEASAQRLCVDGTRRQGAISFVGESGDLNIKVSEDLIRKGIALIGIWHYNLKDIPKLWQVVHSSRQLLDRMITHTFPLTRVEDAWKLQITRKCGKVILHPWA
jgi:L-iditol 2-dehydrogenase